MTPPERERRPGKGGSSNSLVDDISSSPNGSTVVLAIDAERVTNGQLVADCARLGYLPEPVLDPTYGFGGMWSDHRPDLLLAFDTNPDRGVAVADLAALPLADHSVGSVLLDPPYRLGGKPTSNHSGGMDDRYGIDRYRPADTVANMYRSGIIEAARIVRNGGYVLIKCQDQISSGRLHLQTVDVITVGKEIGLKVVDLLHIVGGRPQPPGRRQVHARRNYSTMVVLQVAS